MGGVVYGLLKCFGLYIHSCRLKNQLYTSTPPSFPLPLLPFPPPLTPFPTPSFLHHHTIPSSPPAVMKPTNLDNIHHFFPPSLYLVGLKYQGRKSGGSGGVVLGLGRGRGCGREGMDGPFTLRRRRERNRCFWLSKRGFWGGWKGKSLVFRGGNL